MYVLLSLPWVALVVFVLLRVRLPRDLPKHDSPREDPPPVSVIVPARDEALNIERCMRSLCASEYARFEVIVVDDRSEDGTGDLARSVGPGSAERVEIVEGAEVPEGWLGKPWACWQGAQRARGDLLLFTDADTVHGARLLGRSVAALEEEGADLVTVAGKQIMDSFWERIVQPQIFMTMLLRFHDVVRSTERGRWRDAIANGQFLLFRRAAYEEMGGHKAVKDEVAEDLALAQLAVRGGHRLVLRMAEGDLSTRMYRSLSEMVRGWTKNLVMGGLQTIAPGLRPIVAPGTLVVVVGLWIAPPVMLVLSLAGLGGSGMLPWAALVTGISVLFWALFTRRMGAPARYGLLYPLGALVHAFIYVRSWSRGRRVRWKGRSYVLRPLSERP